MNKCSSVIIQKLRTWFGCRQKEATELDLIFSSLFFSFISISGQKLSLVLEVTKYFVNSRRDSSVQYSGGLDIF